MRDEIFIGFLMMHLMIDFGVGVSTSKVFEVKKVDTDFFVEE